MKSSRVNCSPVFRPVFSDQNSTGPGRDGSSFGLSDARIGANSVSPVPANWANEPLVDVAGIVATGSSSAHSRHQFQDRIIHPASSAAGNSLRILARPVAGAEAEESDVVKECSPQMPTPRAGHATNVFDIIASDHSAAYGRNQLVV